MNSEPTRIDVAGAAERQHLSTRTISRYIRSGKLPAVRERAFGRDGRVVNKVMIEVADLDALFPPLPDLEDAARRLAEETVPTRLNVTDAAQRQRCSTRTINRYIRNGRLPAVRERVLGRDGRAVHKVMIEVADLDAVLPLPPDPDDVPRRFAEATAPKRLDVAEAAERQRCSEQTVRRYIKDGRLPAVSERVLGRNGRAVHKVMIEVADLDAAFPPPLDPSAAARRMAEVTAAAPRITESQRIRIMAILSGRTS